MSFSDANYYATYRAKERQKIADGLCRVPSCANPHTGKSHECAEHSLKRRQYRAAYAAKKAAAGHCRYFGCSRSPAAKRTMCVVHLKKANEVNRIRANKLARKECVNCRAPSEGKWFCVSCRKKQTDKKRSNSIAKFGRVTNGVLAYLPPAHVRILLERANGCCEYCKRPTRRLIGEHIVPLEDGGETTFENIALSCHSCNAQKGRKSLREFLDETGFVFEHWSLRPAYEGLVC